jgi:hypothetical protein
MLHFGLAVLDPKKAELSSTSALATVLAEIGAGKNLHEDSEKLGYWFGELSPFELSSILKVAF